MPSTVSNNPFTPDSNDASIALLREIFGPAITHIASGAGDAANQAQTMLGVAFGYFNSGVLFFGSILLTYVTIFGIANTANDGEALGRKWNTFYTPLRTLGAASVLIPGSSGFSGIQILVLTFVCWSAGFASNMWEKVVSFGISNTIAEQVVSNIFEDDNIGNLTTNAMRMQVCARAVSKAVQSTTGINTNLRLYMEGPSELSLLGFGIGVRKTRLFYKDPNWAGSEDLCGSISYATREITVDKLSDAPSKVFGFRVNPFESAGVSQTTQVLNKSIEDVKSIYINGLFGIGMPSPLAPVIDKVALVVEAEEGTNSPTVSGQELANIVKQFQKELASSIKTKVQQVLQQRISNDTQELTNSLTAGGWIFAGSWHREVSRIMESTRNASTVQFQYSQATMSLEGKLYGETLTAAQSMITRYNLVLSPLISLAVDSDKSSNGEKKIPRLRTDLTIEDFADGGKKVESTIKNYFYNSATESFLTGIVTTLGEGGKDPILQIKSMGDYLTLTGEALILAKAAMSAAIAGILEGVKAANSNVISGMVTVGTLSISAGVFAFISTLLAELWSLVTVPIYTILYAGYFMGIWIPMVPYFMFAIGVAGWVIAVIEATIASSLWAVMHMTPEESFIGSQKQGYLLLLSVFFRPALMVMGLVISMIAMSPIIQFVNWSFVVSFKVMQSNSVTGLFSIAGLLLAYCFVITSILMLVFALPQSLPDRILRWIGAGIGDLGEQSTMSRIESGASSQARTAMVSAATRSAATRQGMNGTKDSVEKAQKVGGFNNEASARPEGHSGQSTVGFNTPPDTSGA